MRAKRRKKFDEGPSKEAMRKSRRKKPYRPPKLVVYGDLHRLTMGSAGPQRDGGGGSPKSKASGAA